MADEINAFTNPEVRRNYLLNNKARLKEEQESEVKAVIVMVKKRVKSPV